MTTNPNLDQLCSIINRATSAGVNAAMDYIEPARYHPSAIRPELLSSLSAPIVNKGCSLEIDYPDHIVTVRCSVSIVPRVPK